MALATQAGAPSLPSARALTVAAAMAALSSCASGPDYAAYLDRWTSATQARLVADWGPPDHRYGDHKGRPTLQYAYHEVLFESLSSDRRIVWWCLTSFHLDGRDRVAATSLRGNHCFPPDDLAGDRARRRAGRSLPTLPPSDYSGPSRPPPGREPGLFAGQELVAGAQ